MTARFDFSGVQYASIGSYAVAALSAQNTATGSVQEIEKLPTITTNNTNLIRAWVRSSLRCFQRLTTEVSCTSAIAPSVTSICWRSTAPVSVTLHPNIPQFKYCQNSCDSTTYFPAGMFEKTNFPSTSATAIRVCRHALAMVSLSVPLKPSQSNVV